MRYVNFDLRVTQNQAPGECQYRVEARSDLAGDASGGLYRVPVKPGAPSDAGGLGLLLNVHGDRAAAGEPYGFAFTEDVVQCYTTSRARLGADQGLRVRLHLPEPDVARLRWEMLYDGINARNFVALSLNTPLVRYLPAPYPIQPLMVQLPLRVLLVTGSSSGLSTLDTAEERNRVTKALEPLLERGLLVLDCIEETTRAALQDKLRQGYHVFHFIGHGRYNANKGGELYLLGDHQPLDRLSAVELAQMLSDTQVRLAVLNACHTAEPAHSNVSQGVGPALIQAGVPAVVGMWGSPRDWQAGIFASEFYEAVAGGLAVDAAVTEGRKALLQTDLTQAEWSIPVLFMRASDGRLFDSACFPGLGDFNLATRAKLERRASAPQPEARRRLRRVVGFLCRLHVEIHVKVEFHLGATPELLAPASCSLRESPVFQWTVGQEIMDACQDVLDQEGSLPPLTAQVTIRAGNAVVWTSSVVVLDLEAPFDTRAEAERVHRLNCPAEIAAQLAGEGKCSWQLSVTYPCLDFQGHVTQRSVTRRAAFRLLSQDERQMLDLMLAEPSIADSRDASGWLLRGAVYEAFGLYDEARACYQHAATDPALHRQVNERLATVYYNQAYELLGLPAEQPSATPLPIFARRANEYSRAALAP